MITILLSFGQEKKAIGGMSAVDPRGANAQYQAVIEVFIECAKKAPNSFAWITPVYPLAKRVRNFGNALVVGKAICRAFIVGNSGSYRMNAPVRGR